MYAQTNIIKDKQLRVTSARTAILEILSKAKKPLDISSIKNELFKLNINADQATIYRIIEIFIKKNLIERLQFEEKKFFYEIIKDEHHHTFCLKCGKITDIPICKVEELENDIENNLGFKTQKHVLTFYGTCKNCI